MTVNVTRLIGGGVAAGVVLNILNVLAQLGLGHRLQHDMNAWMPGSAERISAGAGAIALGIGMKLVIGVLLVWLYAATRHRFSSHFRAVSCVAMFVWILAAIFLSDLVFLGMLSAATYAVLEALQLASFLLAAWVGAWIYRPRSDRMHEEVILGQPADGSDRTSLGGVTAA